MSFNSCTPPMHLPINDYVNLMRGPIVEVRVGPELKVLTLPKELICTYSSYFDRCFNGAFVEANKGSVDLPDVDPVFFEPIAHWLLRGSIEPFQREVEELGALNPRAGINFCLRILFIIDRLSIVGAENIVEKPLKQLIRDNWACASENEKHYTTEELRIIFACYREGHSMREHIAKAILDECIPLSSNRYATGGGMKADSGECRYADAFTNIHGLANEAIKQIWKLNPRSGRKHPFAGN